MLHGSGLSLGPDCDGVLNFMDETPIPSPADDSLKVRIYVFESRLIAQLLNVHAHK